IYRQRLVGELADEMIIEPLAAPVGLIAGAVAAQKSIAAFVVVDDLDDTSPAADDRGPYRHPGIGLRLLKRTPPGSPHPETFESSDGCGTMARSDGCGTMVLVPPSVTTVSPTSVTELSFLPAYLADFFPKLFCLFHRRNLPPFIGRLITASVPIRKA